MTLNDEEKQATIPFFVHERDMVKMAQSNRRLLIALIVALALFVIGFTVNNIAWMRYIERQRTEAGIEETTNPGIERQSDTLID